MSTSIESVTDTLFETEVLQSTVPVLVDFWAAWCGPCKMLTPILEEVAAEYTGKIKFLKMDIEENKHIPSEYSVRGIPTLILYKDGKVVATKVGYQTRSQMADFLEAHA